MRIGEVIFFWIVIGFVVNFVVYLNQPKVTLPNWWVILLLWPLFLVAAIFYALVWNWFQYSETVSMFFFRRKISKILDKAEALQNEYHARFVRTEALEILNAHEQ
jgi:hypothetical protein